VSDNVQYRNTIYYYWFLWALIHRCWIMIDGIVERREACWFMFTSLTKINFAISPEVVQGHSKLH